MTKTSKRYLALTIIFLLIGLCLSFAWRDYNAFSLMKRSAIAWGPAFFFFVVYGLSLCFQSVWFKWITVTISIIGIGYWLLMSAALMFLGPAVSSVTKVSRYEPIIEAVQGEEGDNPLTMHFPRSIPEDAENVRFFFQPPFLQGGLVLQLRYKTTPEKINELYDRFSEQSTRSYFGGSMYEHMNMDDGMPITDFYTNDSGSREFPVDYEIMIFDEPLSEPGQGERHYWNHGESHGVAISREHNEIVYWAEDW
jgi:hypothetical protein